ncbi:MAG: flagellar motor switch protein FliN [Myxococcales bacterium]|nr:flagellar motor switch protein FliN [Myxococcales bacterium]
MAGNDATQVLPDVNEATVAADKAQVGAGLTVVMDVPLRLSVEIGSTQLLVREILQLTKGSIVELDRMNGEPADIYVNERLVARGEVTVVEDRLAVKVVEVVSTESLAGRTR